MENFVLLTIRSAKVRSEHDRLGTIFKGLLQALVLLGSCWCFTSGLGILYGHVLDQASTNKRVMSQV